ncbi:hypothetical protein M422DRAFT_258689 [Sphaerobolus stellatus SS14]|uniref:Uncharacterized protein n=1 Tax=Sphaerobolus stellatus (strain SS14) TaxID=990650 RepID=A0A0C9UUN4_SPHS4|nr:hypothetical protein M422DRAFT_258689 [Sphaerobolus stellatus SS14]
MVGTANKKKHLLDENSDEETRLQEQRVATKRRKTRSQKGLSAPTCVVSEPPSLVKKTAEPEVIDIEAEAGTGESDIDSVITISQSENRRKEDRVPIKSFFTMVDKSNPDDVQFCLVC